MKRVIKEFLLNPLALKTLGGDVTGHVKLSEEEAK
jgi:hypothetical protein